MPRRRNCSSQSITSKDTAPSPRSWNVKGINPVIYVTIETHMGIRAYSEKQLSDSFDTTTLLLDGSWTLDGTYTLGSNSEYMASKDPIILSYDRIQRTLSPKKNDLLTGYAYKRQGSFTVVLNNSDRKMGKLIADEPFITRPLTVYLGYQDIQTQDHIKLFTGVVDEINIDMTSVSITAIES